MSPIGELFHNPTWDRLPAAALPQLIQDNIHARVAIIVVIAVTVLAGVGKVPADVTGAVYTGVVGYVAGRAGNINRGSPSRSEDGEMVSRRGNGADRT